MTLARSKPMSRGTSTMQRSPLKPSTKAPAARSTMKSKGPRMTPIRKAARGQDCTLRIPGVCNWNPETTVLCHSPFLESGRGMGLKAPDEEACFGCSACHDVLDRRVPWPSWMTMFKLEGLFFTAKTLTHARLIKMGIMKCPSP